VTADARGIENRLNVICERDIGLGSGWRKFAPVSLVGNGCKSSNDTTGQNEFQFMFHDLFWFGNINRRMPLPENGVTEKMSL
jgi:hypothetical protein